MILGLSIQTFTVIHVIISLLAIASGILVLIGMLRSNRMPGWTTFFLLSCPALRDFFPDTGILGVLGTGIVSLVLLALALYGLYSKHLSGAWRWIYVTTAVASLYLNVLVLIVNHSRKFRSSSPWRQPNPSRHF